MDCEAVCKLNWTSCVLINKMDQHLPQSISPAWPAAKRFKSKHWPDDPQSNQSTLARIGSEANGQTDPVEMTEQTQVDYIDQLTDAHSHLKDEITPKINSRSNQSCAANFENNSIGSNDHHKLALESQSLSTISSTNNEHCSQNCSDLNENSLHDKQSTNLIKKEVQSNELTPELVTSSNQSNVINRLSELLADSSNNHPFLDTITACVQTSAELEQLEVDKQKLYDHPLFAILGKTG